MTTEMRLIGSTVALHAEGVGRNTLLSLALLDFAVALRAEGVDRNEQAVQVIHIGPGRPPCGGCG